MCTVYLCVLRLKLHTWSKDESNSWGWLLMKLNWQAADSFGQRSKSAQLRLEARKGDRRWPKRFPVFQRRLPRRKEVEDSAARAQSEEEVHMGQNERLMVERRAVTTSTPVCGNQKRVDPAPVVEHKIGVTSCTWWSSCWILWQPRRTDSDHGPSLHEFQALEFNLEREEELAASLSRQNSQLQVRLACEQITHTHTPYHRMSMSIKWIWSQLAMLCT